MDWEIKIKGAIPVFKAGSKNIPNSYLTNDNLASSRVVSTVAFRTIAFHRTKRSRYITDE